MRRGRADCWRQRSSTNWTWLGGCPKELGRRGGGPDGAGLKENPGPPPRPFSQEQHNQKLQEQWEELSSQVRAGKWVGLQSWSLSNVPLWSPLRLPPSLCPPKVPHLKRPRKSHLHKPRPQLFYYGGEQRSQQRAEQQLGTQLVALQVLGRNPEGRTGAERKSGRSRSGAWGGP